MDLKTKLNDAQSQTVKSLAVNPTSDTVLFFFSWRKRYSRVTDLDLLKKDIEHEGFNLDPEDYKTFFTRLEKTGLGVMKYSTNPNLLGSFVWDYSLRTVGKVVYPSYLMSDKDKISRVLKSKQALPRPAPEPPIKGGRPRGAKNKPKPSYLVLPGITPTQAKILQDLWAMWTK